MNGKIIKKMFISLSEVIDRFSWYQPLYLVSVKNARKK